VVKSLTLNEGNWSTEAYCKLKEVVPGR